MSKYALGISKMETKLLSIFPILVVLENVNFDFKSSLLKVTSNRIYKIFHQKFT